MIRLKGKGVSDGAAIGPLYYYRRANAEVPRTAGNDGEAAWTRFAQAQQKALEQLAPLYEKALKDVGKEAAALFETHQPMLEDEDYTSAIRAHSRGAQR